MDRAVAEMKLGSTWVNHRSIDQAVKVEDGKEGCDGRPSVGPVYRSLLAKYDFPHADPDISTAWDIFRLSVEKHPNNRMLGWREFTNGKFGPYIWKTYAEVYNEVIHIGSALRASGAEPGSRVGIYGTNCPQWIVAMEACNAHSLICVPLYDTLGPEAVNYIIDHAEVDFVFVQDKKVEELLNTECAHAKRLKLVVCFTVMTEESKNKAVSTGIKPYSWNNFLLLGKEYHSKFSTPMPCNICTIMYTSGTSGVPKGVVLTHENLVTNIRGMNLMMEHLGEKLKVDDVYISFLPLAHILDRMIEEFFFRNGASVGYYHGDINELRDDMMELKPMCLAAVPRVLEKIHKGVLKAVEELNPVRRAVFKILYQYKRLWLNLGFKQQNASWLADVLAFRKINYMLGGRIGLIVSGGAPLSREVDEFLRVTSCSIVLQGYGLTETCGLTTLGFPNEMSMLGTVGPVFVYSELRLEEVPEMGYNPLGDPPRGEICVRGKSNFAGYYKNPELTQEAFKDGWFHTGDIGEILPNGVVKVIDRKKNLIKLSQGEYVAVEYLEKVYSVTPLVEDIWVYGNSFKSILVAVIIPNEENMKKWANQNGIENSVSELCSLKRLRDYFLLELKSTAERNKLRGFEYIKGVVLEPQPFDVARYLVTPTLKKKRDKLLKYYKKYIDELYLKLSEAS